MGTVGAGLSDGAAAREKAAAYAAQDNLYTVTEFAPDGDVAVRVIGAMIDYLHAPPNPKPFSTASRSPMPGSCRRPSRKAVTT